MPERVQSLRSTVKGVRPAGGSRQVGEIFFNFADLQFGVIDVAKAPRDLIAVRFFSTAADYAVGSFVVQAGVCYRAKVVVAAGAFNPAQWDTIATTADLSGKENTIAAGTVAQYWRGDKSWQALDKAAVGLANVDNTSDINKPVSTAQGVADNARVVKAGDVMTGHLGLPAGPAATQAVRKDYVDAADAALSAAIAASGIPEAPNDGKVYGRKSVAWALADPLTAERRNRFVNPAMQISQENGDATGININGYFAADQWQGYYLAAGLSSVFYRRTPALTPNGSLSRLRVNCNTPKPALAAGDYYEVYQPLEGIQVADLKWGTAQARQVVLRFGFAGPAGTYCIGFRNVALNRCYLKKFVIPVNTVDTEVVIVIPGDVTGAWTTTEDAGIYFHIGLAAGTAQQAPAEGWQGGTFIGVAGMSNGLGAIASFELFDFGLYLDPLNTGLPPAWETPNFADELARCQRYWQTIYGIGWTHGVVTGIGLYINTSLLGPLRPGGTVSGANATNSNFPATVGTLVLAANSIREIRTANATAAGGGFATQYTANARM